MESITSATAVPAIMYQSRGQVPSWLHALGRRIFEFDSDSDSVSVIVLKAGLVIALPCPAGIQRVH
jgi:hypothetical protein